MVVKHDRDHDQIAWDALWHNMITTSMSGTKQFIEVLFAGEDHKRDMLMRVYGWDKSPATDPRTYQHTEEWNQEAETRTDGRMTEQERIVLAKVNGMSGGKQMTAEELRAKNEEIKAHNAAEKKKYEDSVQKRNAEIKAFEDAQRQRLIDIQKQQAQLLIDQAKAKTVKGTFNTYSNIDLENQALGMNSLANEPVLQLIRYSEHSNKNFKTNRCYHLAYGNKHMDFSNMSIQQVLDWQSKQKYSAVGAYQFIRSTLKDLVDKVGISKSTKFTPAVQDFLAMELLKRECGYESYLFGNKTAEQLLGTGSGKKDQVGTVSHQWRSIASMSGKIVDHNDGINKMKTGIDLALSLIKKAKVFHLTRLKNSGYLSLPLGSNKNSSLGKRDLDEDGKFENHRGLDLRARTPIPFYSPAKGVVALTTADKKAVGGGNYMSVWHGGNIYTTHMHLSKFGKKVGDEVQKGEALGLTGNSGAKAFHLHTETAIYTYNPNTKEYVAYVVDPVLATRVHNLAGDAKAQKALILHSIKKLGLTGAVCKWFGNVPAEYRPPANQILQFDPMSNDLSYEEAKQILDEHKGPQEAIGYNPLSPSFMNAAEGHEDGHDHDHGEEYGMMFHQNMGDVTTSNLHGGLRTDTKQHVITQENIG